MYVLLLRVSEGKKASPASSGGITRVNRCLTKQALLSGLSPSDVLNPLGHFGIVYADSET